MQVRGAASEVAKRSLAQRGVALLICLFALMLLSAIGLSMVFMADTEATINRNYRDSRQAHFAAAGGLQEVRERLMPSSASNWGQMLRPRCPALASPAA